MSSIAFPHINLSKLLCKTESNTLLTLFYVAIKIALNYVLLFIKLICMHENASSVTNRKQKCNL